MPGPSRELLIRLYRDALTTPWGFRLQGGKDLKQPLTIAKVSAGSPVDGELCRGDVVLEIQNCDATQMTHQKAQEMIKNSGGSLLLRVRRSGYHEPQQKPAAPSGLSVLPGQQTFMLHRIQDTLSGLRIESPDYDYGAPYNSSSRKNNDYGAIYPTTQQFASLQNAVQIRESKYPDRMYSTLPKPKNAVQLPLGLAEPGWTPKPASQKPPAVATSRRPIPVASAPPPAAYTRPRSLEPERPAWEGSLRSSTNPHLTDMRIQIQPSSQPAAAPRMTEIAHFSPINSPGQRHSSPWSQDSETARIVNLQYNSPLALYSKALAEETLYTQTAGKPGFGTSQIRSESDVFSLVEENDRRSFPNASSQSTGSRNHSYQSIQVGNNHTADHTFTDF